MPKKVIAYEKTQPETYSTTDTAVAAYLKTLGIRLVNLTRDAHRTTFIFADPEQCQEAALAWINEDSVDVQAHVFSRELSRMKNLAMRGSL